MFYKRSHRFFANRRDKVNEKTVSHPKYVIGEKKDNYYSLGLTHSAKKGKSHKNYPLKKNPRFGDVSPSYLRKKIENYPKKQFSKRRLNNYRMSKEDDEYVDELIRKSCLK